MIVLASTSPTRQLMLRNAGLEFAAAPPQVDERGLVARHPEWSPEDVALRLAETKALDVSGRYPDALVIGADQVLALHGKPYAKPSSRDECRSQLLELRGHTHILISAVVCARNGQVEWAHQDSSQMTMRSFSDHFLDLYLDRIGDDCTASVGGYKIEGPGLQLFETVRGDHFTILGLPLLPLLAHLRDTGEIPS